MSINEKDLKLYDRVLATVSALAIIIGGLWSLNGILKSREIESQLLLKQIRQTEYYDKKNIYYELCDAESELAACNTYSEVLEAQKHFRKLYLGRAHIIAALDKAINNQKVEFNELLTNYIEQKPSIAPFYYFGPSCLKLVDSCKKFLDMNQAFK